MAKRIIIRGGNNPDSQEVDLNVLPKGRSKRTIEKNIAEGRYTRREEEGATVYTPRGGENKG